jgi:hypothetical protein
MNPKYMVAVASMLALGVVSTLAFTLNSATGIVPNPVLIESEADNDITRIIVLPGIGASDDSIRMLIQVGETWDTNDKLECQFLFGDSSYDPITITDATAEYRVTAGSWTAASNIVVNVDLGEITFDLVPTDNTPDDLIWLRINLTDIYTNTDSLQASVDVVAVT